MLGGLRQPAFYPKWRHKREAYQANHWRSQLSSFFDFVLLGSSQSQGTNPKMQGFFRSLQTSIKLLDFWIVAVTSVFVPRFFDLWLPHGLSTAFAFLFIVYTVFSFIHRLAHCFPTFGPSPCPLQCYSCTCPILYKPVGKRLLWILPVLPRVGPFLHAFVLDSDPTGVDPQKPHPDVPIFSPSHSMCFLRICLPQGIIQGQEDKRKLLESSSLHFG